MRPTRMTGWLAPLAVVVLFLSLGTSASAEVCVVVNPVLDIGCRESQGAPTGEEPTVSSEPAGVPGEPQPVARNSTTVRYDPRHVAVRFRPGVSRVRAREVIEAAGGTLDLAVPQILSYLVGVEPDERADVLAALDGSSAVADASKEPIAEIADTKPDDEDWPQQDGLRVAGFPQAWDVTQGSSGIVVAVVDTGVDASHPDLRGALVPGWNVVAGNADPTDDHGHGTAVAGVIAARSNNRAGGAGICWRCLVMPIKALDSTGSGDDTHIAAGIVWATDHGAQVINLSLGGPGASAPLTSAMSYASSKGVIVVAAAGNGGVTTQFFPAADPHAVSVAATTVADQRFSWSNFGSWVRLAAPGCNLAPSRGGGYGMFCGTSSATPLVSGLAALELSVQPTATAREAEDALARAAVPLPAFVQYGRIDAGKTLALLRPAGSSRVVFRGTLGPNVRSRAFAVAVGPGPLTAALSFTGRKRLTLTTPLGRATGRTPLQVAGTATAGVFTLRVDGDGAKTKFVLNVTFAK
jgi:subtilisin family serine protease